MSRIDNFSIFKKEILNAPFTHAKPKYVTTYIAQSLIRNELDDIVYDLRVPLIKRDSNGNKFYEYTPKDKSEKLSHLLGEKEASFRISLDDTSADLFPGAIRSTIKRIKERITRN